MKWPLTKLAMAGSVMAALSVTSGAEEKAQSIFADMENPELMRMARYQLDITEFCAPISDETKKQELYRELVNYEWDRKAMGCALDYGQELIEEDFWSLFAIEDKLTLLGARAQYFSVLSKQYNAHYQGGELTDELAWRWDNNRRAGLRLIDELNVFEALVPEVPLVKTAFLLASTQRETETSETLTISSDALAVLTELVEQDSGLLDGLGSTLLGQMLISLPEFSGGDPLKAIELLQASIEQNPSNLIAHRWLIEGFVFEREDELAREFLAKASQVSVDSLPPQEYVDLAKELAGVALRLGQPQVAQVFVNNRRKLLKSKPYLLERVERASVGHGGENPITGEMHSEL